MCRANAKATPKEAQQAINRAILVMIMPPIGAVSLGTTLIVRYARRRDRENERLSAESATHARLV
jgi:cytochrome c-type biogenesis protein CcmH/NrfF